MSNKTTFRKAKPTIIASLGLEGAKECQDCYETEYHYKRHPNHPKVYLLWADIQDDKYIFRELKVLGAHGTAAPGAALPERLTYAVGRVGFSKRDFGENGSIDSEAFTRFKDSNGMVETPFFRARMEKLLSENKWTLEQTNKKQTNIKIENIWKTNKKIWYADLLCSLKYS